MPDAEAAPVSPLEPSAALIFAALGTLVACICLTLLLAPRLIWPDRLRREPEPPEELPDWKWPWLFLLPPLIVGLQLVAFPLQWAGVPKSLWLAFGVSMGSGVATVALAWQFLCRRAGKPARALGLRSPRWKPHLALLPVFGWPLGMSLILLAILFEVVVLKRPLPQPQASMKAVRSITDPGLRILALAAVVVVAPIAEEILFRGVLFRGLNLRWGFVPAMLVSAALFSAAHVDLDHASSIFMLGLVLAFLAWESSSLYPGILLHAMVNGFAIWATWTLPAPGAAG